MKLTVVTTNEQQGDVSVEIVSVTDSNNLVLVVEKRGDEPATVKGAVIAPKEVELNVPLAPVETPVEEVPVVPMSKRIKIGK